LNSQESGFFNTPFGRTSQRAKAARLEFMSNTRRDFGFFADGSSRNLLVAILI